MKHKDTKHGHNSVESKKRRKEPEVPSKTPMPHNQIFCPLTPRQSLFRWEKDAKRNTPKDKRDNRTKKTAFEIIAPLSLTTN